jgi:hypothetical protein
MLHAEGILLQIMNDLEPICDDYELLQIRIKLHEAIKTRLLNNNFTDLNTHEFSEYCYARLLEFGSIIDRIIKEDNDYTKSSKFNVKITDIFSHACSCYNFNNEKIKETNLKYIKNYDKLLKELI